ncbi:hypothetical protein IAU60_004615 [Kwoniella sp. DSM 27419]
MPIVHLILITTHLILSTIVPYLLIKWFVQPLVLWIICAATLCLELVYLVPGIIIELIGLIRRRPVGSAWLQAGNNLVIMILALLPHSLTAFLLLTATQVPSCPSALFYTPPKFATFESYLRWSTCAALPTITVLSMVNLVTVLLQVIVTATAIGIDCRIQKKRERERERVRLSVVTAGTAPASLRGTLSDRAESGVKSYRPKLLKKRRRLSEWRESTETPPALSTPIARIAPWPNAQTEPLGLWATSQPRRRWTTGVGRLLWDIEGYVRRYGEGTVDSPDR